MASSMILPTMSMSVVAWDQKISELRSFEKDHHTNWTSEVHSSMLVARYDLQHQRYPHGQGLLRLLE
jgi:hypothetical protein